MQQLRIFGVIIALISAFSVLGLSLSSVGMVHSAGLQVPINQKELYFDTKILPDHVGYPVLMAIDRVRLETAVPVEQVFIRLDYAERRMHMAMELLEKDKHELALVTATKAQKYLIAAAEQVAEMENPPEDLRVRVIHALENHMEMAESISEGVDGSHSTMLGQLAAECRALLDRLQS